MSVADVSPQAGIFALGTSSHSYIELALKPGGDPLALVTALASLREPRTTIGGVNLVVGFRPELWRDQLGLSAPADLRSFDEPMTGADGFVVPATQHDAVLWLAGSSYDVIFDEARGAITTLAGIADVVNEIVSWPYRHDRDLTGFIDGTENPSLARAAEVALVPADTPGAGGSILLLQQWAHDAPTWEALSVEQQEQAMGRTKADSLELDPRPETSHVARTDQDDFGHIFRRNMPYGTMTEHGTVFVGFAGEQRPLRRMLESMAGLDGPRDEITRYTTPLTGAYYFVPPIGALRRYAPDDD